MFIKKLLMGCCMDTSGEADFFLYNLQAVDQIEAVSRHNTEECYPHNSSSSIIMFESNTIDCPIYKSEEKLLKSHHSTEKTSTE